MNLAKKQQKLMLQQLVKSEKGRREDVNYAVYIHIRLCFRPLLTYQLVASAPPFTSSSSACFMGFQPPRNLSWSSCYAFTVCIIHDVMCQLRNESIYDRRNMSAAPEGIEQCSAVCLRESVDLAVSINQHTILSSTAI